MKKEQFHPHPQHLRGVFLLLGAALLWSSGGVLIKLVDAAPMAISSGRSVFAALTLILLTRRIPLRPEKSILFCGVLYALTVGTFVVATRLTSATNAIVLQYTAPVYVALFSAYFLGESISKWDWLTIGCVAVGMLLFFAESLRGSGTDLGSASTMGNIIAITSGMSFAATVLMLRKLRAQNPADAIIVGNVLSFFLGLPWLLSNSWSHSSLLGIFLLGTFQLGLAYFFYTKAVSHVTALEAVLIPVIEPLLNPIWVYLMIGEAPSSWAFIGAVIILGAITTRSLLKQRGVG